MLKLLIVDDEHWIREGLKLTIDWKRYGIQVAGEAENGAKALLMIEENAPDIVISDIKMPTMDGLALMEELRKRGIRAKVIFISGFSDFAYAQQAVKLGAFDYLLKPIEEPALLDIVERCVLEIAREREETLRLEQMSGCIRESLPLARERYLEMCLTQPRPRDELAAKWQALAIRLPPERLLVLTAVVHQWGERGVGESGCALMRYALGNMAEEVLGEAGLRSVSCPMNDNEFIDLAVIVSPPEDEDGNGAVREAAERLIGEAAALLGIRITVGLSGRRPQPQLAELFAEAIAGTVEYVNGGMEKVYTASSGPPAKTRAAARPKESEEAMANRLLHAFMLSDEGRLGDLLDELGAQFLAMRERASALEVRRAMNGLARTVLSRWEELCAAKDVGTQLSIPCQRRSALFRSTIGEWKNAFLAAFVRGSASAAPLSQKRTIETALAYIHEHYQLGISLCDIAETMHLNPSYFSRLFHEEVGETLSRYLIRIRMAKAKELLRGTPLKIYEIAEKVGYNDFRHFVKTFKEWEGVTPAQYRNHGV